MSRPERNHMGHGGLGAAKHILIISNNMKINRSHTDLISIIPMRQIMHGMLILVTLSPPSAVTMKC